MTNYTPHVILELCDEDVLALTLMQIRMANPNLKIGEKVGYCDKVWRGKVVPRFLDHDPIVKLDYTVPHVDRPYIELDGDKHVKLPFDDQSAFSMFKDMTGYLYPMSAVIPHAKWLKVQQPGDVVNLHDVNYYASPYTLTEEDFSKHSYVLFRFYLSDQ